MNKALLTMGMVVYNEEKYIAKAIESLLAQTFQDFILIISDNASTDKTQEICKAYAKNDKRIVYVRHQKNMGTLANWRYVINQATTPYFALCGGHDKWHPCFAEKLLLAFNDEKVVLSYPLSAHIDENGVIGKILKNDYSTVSMEKPADRYLFFLRRYNAEDVFFGIWKTQTLKDCDLNFVSPTMDILILEQGALEGKFKQCKEVLYWTRGVRKEETYNEMIRRQIAAVRGQPKNTISLFSIKTEHLLYVFESIKVIFRKHYELSLFIRFWLLINIIYVKVLYRYTMFFIRSISKTLLPRKVFLRVTNFWHRNQYQN